VAPEMARTLIREGAKSALARLSSVKPLVVPKPVKLEIVFKSMINAEVLAFLPNVERVDGSTIAFTAKDPVEMMRFLSFVAQYDSNQ
jgi:D-amino peptidase